METREIDIICVGEILIDLIGDDVAESLAQTSILQKAEEAFDKGCQLRLSIDLNYAQKIWGDTVVLPVLKAYCQYQPLVKIGGEKK